jgi:hypothetical protein
MKNLFRITLGVYLYQVLLVLLLLAAFICFFFFINVVDQKTAAIFGGLTTGLFIAFIQLLLSWFEHNEIEGIKKLRIKKVLPHRDDEMLYRSVISKAKDEILVLGNTALRFLNDFADESRPDKKALIDALSRKVHVRFLLPSPEYLGSRKDKDGARIAARMICELTMQFKEHFECRYYDHAPFHNMVRADEECLVGPIFPHISSKNSPAIYTDIKSIYVAPYLEYFEHEWEKARHAEC